MKSLKLITQGPERKVFIAEMENGRIADARNITGDFNNCVINLFKNNSRTIKDEKGNEYKVILEHKPNFYNGPKVNNFQNKFGYGNK